MFHHPFKERGELTNEWRDGRRIKPVLKKTNYSYAGSITERVEFWWKVSIKRVGAKFIWGDGSEKGGERGISYAFRKGLDRLVSGGNSIRTIGDGEGVR